MKNMRDYLKQVKVNKLLLEMLSDEARSNNVITEYPYGKQITRLQLFSKIVALGRYLDKFDEVVLQASNSINWIIMTYACLLYGKRIYLLDSEVDEEARANYLAGIEPDVYIYEKDLEDLMIWAEDTDSSVLSQFIIQENYNGEIVLFTSGTTGKPKGVIIDFKHIIENFAGIQENFRIDQMNCGLMISPFSHSMGWVMLGLSLFYGGDIAIVTEKGFIPQAIRKLNCSYMALPPVLINIISKVPECMNQMKEYRFIVSGSAGMPGDYYKKYHLQGIKLLNGYGMTECVSAIATGVVGEWDQLDGMKVLTNCDIRIAEDGEILVRGKTVCNKYLSGEPIMDDLGYYHTKDIGVLENERLRVLYRKDSVMLLPNGYKVNRTVLENKIMSIPEICECHVIPKEINGVMSLTAEVVMNEDSTFKGREQDLLSTINSKLEYFEKLTKVYMRDSLGLKGWKKS